VNLDLVVLGPPGAGKGTQAKRIAAAHGTPHISTGEMLREAMAEGSELGVRVKEIVEAGNLVPDDLMIDLIRNRLSHDDTHEGFILDGFPRTLVQAEALDDLLDEMARPISIALDFQLDDDVAYERLTGRAHKEGRPDDRDDVIWNRISVYKEMTLPISEHYRAKGILVGIHAARPEHEVFAEIERALEQVTVR